MHVLLFAEKNKIKGIHVNQKYKTLTVILVFLKATLI